MEITINKTPKLVAVVIYDPVPMPATSPGPTGWIERLTGERPGLEKKFAGLSQPKFENKRNVIAYYVEGATAPHWGKGLFRKDGFIVGKKGYARFRELYPIGSGPQTQA